MNGTVRTFVGNPPYPAKRDDWQGCGRAAAQLLEQRQARDPEFVDTGKLTPDDAARRLRIMGAIVELWRILNVGAPLHDCRDWRDALGASLEEMHADLTVAATRATGDLAAYAEALRWHLEPITPGSLPHIVIAEDHVRWETGSRLLTARHRPSFPVPPNQTDAASTGCVL